MPLLCVSVCQRVHVYVCVCVCVCVRACVRNQNEAFRAAPAVRPSLPSVLGSVRTHTCRNCPRFFADPDKGHKSFAFPPFGYIETFCTRMMTNVVATLPALRAGPSSHVYT